MTKHELEYVNDVRAEERHAPPAPGSLYCRTCGSRHVQIAAWIRPNSFDAVCSAGADGPSDREWCETCDQRGMDGETSLTTDRSDAARARYRWRRAEADGCTCEVDYEPGAVPLHGPRCEINTRRPRCTDCGAYDQLTGHMGCPSPGDRRDARDDDAFPLGGYGS